MHKIRRSAAYLSICLTFFIQIFLSGLLDFTLIKPNLMIIMTTFFALFTDKKFGFEIGLFSGLLLDFFSIRFFGLNAILFAIGGYIAGKYNNKFYKESIITHIILTFLMSYYILSSYFLFVNLRSISAPSSIRLNVFFNPTLLFVSLFNSFIGIWVYAFLLRVFRLSERLL